MDFLPRNISLSLLHRPCPSLNQLVASPAHLPAVALYDPGSQEPEQAVWLTERRREAAHTSHTEESEQLTQPGRQSACGEERESVCERENERGTEERE